MSAKQTAARYQKPARRSGDEGVLRSASQASPDVSKFVETAVATAAPTVSLSQETPAVASKVVKSEINATVKSETAKQHPVSTATTTTPASASSTPISSPLPSSDDGLHNLPSQPKATSVAASVAAATAGPVNTLKQPIASTTAPSTAALKQSPPTTAGKPTVPFASVTETKVTAVGAESETVTAAKPNLKEIPQAEWMPLPDATMGAVILDLKKGVTGFRLWGPHIAQCWVSFGSEETQRVEMVSDGASGMYACQVQGVFPGQAYHYVLTSNWNDCYDTEGVELHRRDPYARQTDFDTNTCYVVDPSSFKWDSFKAPLPKDFIIYELHVGTFASVDGKSQFAAAAAHLKHIKDLGFTAVELMPVTEFGGLWGYNPRLLMAPHGKYGTPRDLQTLVNEAHNCGLAVIFDLVLNHGSVRKNSLWNYDGYGPKNNGGIYFEGESDSGWGSRFAFHKREVCDMIKAATVMFANDYNADGLRLDAVHHMPWHFLKEVCTAVKSSKADCFITAEITPENPAVCNECNIDSCWIHSTYYDAMNIMQGREKEHQIAQIKAIVNGHSGFHKAHQSINSVLGSHDQCGNRNNGNSGDDSRIGRYFVDQLGGRGNWHGRAQCRMWMALQAVARPLPMVFMGSELLQGGWWHIDKFLDWGLIKNDTTTQQMMALTRTVNEVRLKHFCSSDDQKPSWCHEDAANRVLGFHRYDNFVVVNFGETQWDKSNAYHVRTNWQPKSIVDQIFNSQAEEFGGWEESWTAAKAEVQQTSPATGQCGHRTSVSVGDGGLIEAVIPKWSVIVFHLKQ